MFSGVKLLPNCRNVGGISSLIGLSGGNVVEFIAEVHLCPPIFVTKDIGGHRKPAWQLRLEDIFTTGASSLAECCSSSCSTIISTNPEVHFTPCSPSLVSVRLRFQDILASVPFILE